MAEAPGERSDDKGRSFIDLIGDLAAESGPDGLTVGQIRDRMDERAFGLLIFVLSIPCLVPALYGVPQIVGIPIVLLAAQIVAGRHEPWLPRGILERRVARPWLERMASFSDQRLRWLEQLSRPRLRAFACGLGEKLGAVFIVLATLTIILPMTNTIPSVAVALVAVGLIQRDGLFVLAGSAAAAVWATLVVSVPVAAFVFGAPWALSLWDWMAGALKGLFS